jgi:hypothetical protein
MDSSSPLYRWQQQKVAEHAALIQRSLECAKAERSSSSSSSSSKQRPTSHAPAPPVPLRVRLKPFNTLTLLRTFDRRCDRSILSSCSPGSRNPCVLWKGPVRKSRRPASPRSREEIRYCGEGDVPVLPVFNYKKQRFSAREVARYLIENEPRPDSLESHDQQQQQQQRDESFHIVQPCPNMDRCVNPFHQTWRTSPT